MPLDSCIRARWQQIKEDLRLANEQCEALKQAGLNHQSLMVSEQCIRRDILAALEGELAWVLNEGYNHRY